MEGLRYSLRQPAVRTMLLAIAVLNVAVAGPGSVGLPLLAQRVFAGPTSFGWLMSCFGGAALIGAALAGTVLRAAPLGRLMTLTLLGFAVALGSLAFAQTLVPALVALGTMGIAVGLLNVRGVAWLQAQADEAFRGRLMSLVMFASVGLAPLSLAAAGALVGVGLAPLFLGAGALVLLVTAAVVGTPSLRRLGVPAAA
jgi:MFS family permease